MNIDIKLIMKIISFAIAQYRSRPYPVHSDSQGTDSWVCKLIFTGGDQNILQLIFLHVMG